jgi:transcriptional regulator with XRE-family HTH domain
MADCLLIVGIAPTQKKRVVGLKQAREQRSLTQNQLAELLEVDVQTISSWERGTRFPSVALRSRLAHALGKSLEELGLLLHEQSWEEESASSERSQTHTAHTVSEESPGSVSVVRDESFQRMVQRARAHFTAMQARVLPGGIAALPTLREQPDASQAPWNRIMPAPDQEEASATPVSTISSLSERADEGLLILGEPGSGKTTLLLHMAHALSEQVARGEHHQLPVVLDLASWTGKQPSFELWLLDALATTYQFPRQMSRHWIATDRIPPAARWAGSGRARPSSNLYQGHQSVSTGA